MEDVFIAIMEQIAQEMPELSLIDEDYGQLEMGAEEVVERMVLSDLMFGAATPAGWALISDPTDKERRFLERLNIEIVESAWTSLLERAPERV